MAFFYKFWKKARVYYTLSISRGGGGRPPGPPWIRIAFGNLIGYTSGGFVLQLSLFSHD